MKLFPAHPHNPEPQYGNITLNLNQVLNFNPQTKLTSLKKLFSLKNIVLALLVFLTAFALILTTLIVTFDDDDYQRLLIRLIDFSSDYQLEISGPFHFNPSATPKLSASNIVLKSKTNDNTISLKKFEVKVMLRPLLDGTLLIDRLHLADMIVQLTDSAEEETDFDFSPGYFWPTPVLKSASIKNIVIKDEAENDSYILDHLLIDNINELKPLRIDASGLINDKPFSAKGQLGSLRELFAGQPYKVDINLVTPQLAATLQGQASDALHGKGLDLQLNFEATSLKKIFGIDFPDSTRLSGKGKLRGDLYQPELSDLDMALTREDLTRVTATGSIADIITLNGIDIKLNGVIKDPEFTPLLFSNSMPQYNDISFDASLVNDEEIIKLTNIKARLSDPLGLNTSLTGSMDFNLDTDSIIQAMAITATFSAPTTLAAQPFLIDILPEMGPVSGKVTLNSPDMDLAIKDIDIVLGHGRAVSLQIKGYIGKVPLDADTPSSDIVLDLTVNADRAKSIGKLLKQDLPDIGPVTLTTRYSGNSETGQLDNLQLTAGNKGSLFVNAEGYIHLLYKETVSLNSLINIRAESTSLSKASRSLGFDLPDVGPVKTSMILYSNGGDFSIRDIKTRIGQDNKLLLNLAGSINKIPVTSAPVSGIDLQASFKARSTSSLSVLSKDTKIPDIGPVAGQFNIKGNSNAVSISEITLDAGHKNKLNASVRGKIDQLIFADKQMKGADITLSAAAPTTSALSALAGQKVIDMGPFSLTAKIESQQKLLQLNNIDIIAGPPEDPAIHASGSVKNLMEGSEININIPFNEQILHQFFSMNIKDTVPLSGNILLSDADGSLGIDSLTLKTEQSNIMAVSIRGGIDDIMHGDEIIINGSVSIEDLQRVGNIFNQDLPPLGPINFEGKLTGSNEKSNFDGLLKFNQTEITSNLTLLHLDEQPTIKGILSIPVLHLQDIGIKAKPQNQNQQTQTKEHKADHFFSRTPIAFDKLHDINLDLKIDIDEVEGTEFKVDTVDMNILLNKGVLDIHPVKFKYADGQVNTSLSITADNPPRLKFKLSGDDIDLNGLMQQALIPSPIEGNMNLTLDLSASGLTAHEIASNLDGEIGITLENGRLLRSRYIDVLFLDLVDWLFTFGVTKNETRFNCAIARYTIKHGKLNTDILYLDGPKLFVRGEGTVDLNTEIVDITVNLEKKRFLRNSRIPISIQGTLPNPTVMAIPYKQAVIRVSGYVFAPFISLPLEALGSVGKLLFEPGGNSSCQDSIAKL